MRSRRFFLFLLLSVAIILILVGFLAYFITRQPATVTTPTPTPTGTTTPSTGAAVYPANIEYNNGGYGVYSQAALQNPNIGGIDVTMDWSKVETQQGVINWTPLDNELRAWGSVGKKLVIIIRYALESGANGTSCSGGQLLPAWITTGIKSLCDADHHTIIPDYFDPTFQSNLKAYVKAVADHIAATPYKKNIIFVRIGLGVGGEGAALMAGGSHYQEYQQQLQAWGYTPTNWIQFQENMLSSFKSAFSYTTVIYPINVTLPPTNNPLNTNPKTGNPVWMDVAYWAAANGFGVGQQGLTPNYTYADIQQITGYIQQHYPSTFIQLAAYAPMRIIPHCRSNPSTSCEANLVQGCIQTAEKYGARTVDWWYPDDNNPAFQSYFAQWQQYVNNKFGSVHTSTPTGMTPSTTSSPHLGLFV